MKHLYLILLMCLSFGSLSSVQASEQDVLMVRSTLPFPEAMSVLQNTIIDNHYTLSRVQRIDVGLEKAGYKTDRYRIVFYGKHEEIKAIVEKHPEMAAYLPLKFALFSEDDDTLLVALNPVIYSNFVEDKSLKTMFDRWAADAKLIMEQFSKAE